MVEIVLISVLLCQQLCVRRLRYGIGRHHIPLPGAPAVESSRTISPFCVGQKTGVKAETTIRDPSAPAPSGTHDPSEWCCRVPVPTTSGRPVLSAIGCYTIREPRIPRKGRWNHLLRQTVITQQISYHRVS